MGILLLVLADFGAGAVATISDFRDGKIYNRDLVVFGLIGFTIYLIYYPELLSDFGIAPVINALITLLISFLFFYAQFWSAGDAKLFCLTAILMPFPLYQLGLLFPAFHLLSVIFCLAFSYVMAESVFLYFKESRLPESRRYNSLPKITRIGVLEWVSKYTAGLLLLTCLNQCLVIIAPEIPGRDPGLVIVTETLLLCFLFNRLKNWLYTYSAILIGLVANIVFQVVFAGTTGFQLDIRGPIVALLAVVVIRFAGKYNDARIPVSDLRPGMVLSPLTLAELQLRRVRELPEPITGALASRLSSQQVDSIMKWTASRVAHMHVIVVSQVPFAPFILVGTIAYVTLVYASQLH